MGQIGQDEGEGVVGQDGGKGDVGQDGGGGVVGQDGGRGHVGQDKGGGVMGQAGQVGQEVVVGGEKPIGELGKKLAKDIKQVSYILIHSFFFVHSVVSIGIVAN